MKSTLLQSAAEIDRVLRGRFTSAEQLSAGRVPVPVLRLVQASLVLGVLYGLCMGLFPVLRDPGPGSLQLLATLGKVPLLFLLTLLVTYPSLYVFSALAGSRLDAAATLRLLIVAVTVNLAVLAALGPVMAFFVLCTESYLFIKLLNVMLFGIGGVVSLVFLRRALDHVFEPEVEDAPREVDPVDEDRDDGPAATLKRIPPRRVADRKARRIFRVWIVVYGIVGAQMGWVMRPFLGSPDLPFELFRARQSHFFENVLESIRGLFV